jgi:hypothetical protein
MEDSSSGCSGNVLSNDTTDGHVSKISWTDSNGTAALRSCRQRPCFPQHHDQRLLKRSCYDSRAPCRSGRTDEYSFVPAANFSGKVPTLTYELSNNSGTPLSTAANVDANGLHNTLDISVTPVSDTPTVTGSSVSGNENTAIGLGLTLPVVTDTTDLNGKAAGDSSERFGYIDIKGIPNTAVVKNGTDALTTDSGTLHIIISDKADYQLSDLATTGTGVYTMTQAEFAALTIQQYNDAAHSSVYAHANISTGMTIAATSYEVDNTGVQVTNVDGTKVAGVESTANIKVGVQAVTDATPSLSMSSIDLPAVNEDSPIKISGSYFTSGLTNVLDTDGSEKVTLRVSGLKSGSSISYDTDGDGTAETYKAGGDGIVNIPIIKSIADSSVSIKDFSISAPAHYSGTMSGITFSLVTQDTDADSKTPTEKVAEAANTLTLNVNPVADPITALNTIQADGKEDTPISLSGKIIPESSDTDGSQKYNVEIDGIKTGSTIKYDGTDYTIGSADTTGVDVTDNGNDTFSVVIKDFDSSKLSYQAPLDENGE